MVALHNCDFVKSTGQKGCYNNMSASYTAKSEVLWRACRVNASFGAETQGRYYRAIAADFSQEV